jgi:hypothetical protein
MKVSILILLGAALAAFAAGGDALGATTEAGAAAPIVYAAEGTGTEERGPSSTFASPTGRCAG